MPIDIDAEYTTITAGYEYDRPTHTKFVLDTEKIKSPAQYYVVKQKIQRCFRCQHSSVTKSQYRITVLAPFCPTNPRSQWIICSKPFFTGKLALLLMNDQGS